jgi:hypothetical protein
MTIISGTSAANPFLSNNFCEHTGIGFNFTTRLQVRLWFSSQWQNNSVIFIVWPIILGIILKQVLLIL